MQKIWGVILEKYRVVRKIGSGAYGVVWKVVEIQTQKVYALKKMIKGFSRRKDSQKSYRELRILQQLTRVRHQNIIALQKFFFDTENKDVYLVFQLMDTSLSVPIRQNQLQQVHVKYILVQILRALKFLHSAKVIHRDIKPLNVLLNANGRAKLCDFGLARSFDDGHELTADITTLWYCAPEVLLGAKAYGCPSDMWSVGCVFAQMLKGYQLFKGDQINTQLQLIFALTGNPNISLYRKLGCSSEQLTLLESINPSPKTLEQLVPLASKKQRELLSLFLRNDPEERITASQALKHPYLEEFRNVAKERTLREPFELEVSDSVLLETKRYVQLVQQLVDPKRKERNAGRRLQDH